MCGCCVCVVIVVVVIVVVVVVVVVVVCWLSVVVLDEAVALLVKNLVAPFVGSFVHDSAPPFYWVEMLVCRSVSELV